MRPRADERKSARSRRPTLRRLLLIAPASSYFSSRERRLYVLSDGHAPNSTRHVASRPRLALAGVIRDLFRRRCAAGPLGAAAALRRRLLRRHDCDRPLDLPAAGALA